MNHFFSQFVKMFGAPVNRCPVPEDDLSRYTGKLPDALLEFWREVGWGAFAKGLFWTVNPEAFLLQSRQWFGKCHQLMDEECIVYGRSAFGDLYAWQPKAHRVLLLSCVFGYVIADKKFKDPAKADGMKMNSFFAVADPTSFDLEDENEVPLFNQLIERLGPLQSNEVYGFEQPLVTGGAPAIHNIRKMNIDEYLNSLCKLSKLELRLI